MNPVAPVIATERISALVALLSVLSRRTTLSSTVASLDYIHVTYGEPHAQRARQMLAAHPELRELAGPKPTTALWVLPLVAVQLAIAVLVGIEAGSSGCPSRTSPARRSITRSGR